MSTVQNIVAFLGSEFRNRPWSMETLGMGCDMSPEQSNGIKISCYMTPVLQALGPIITRFSSCDDAKLVTPYSAWGFFANTEGNSLEIKPLVDIDLRWFQEGEIVIISPRIEPSVDAPLFQEIRTRIPDGVIKRHRNGDTSKAFFGGYDNQSDACRAAGKFISRTTLPISSITIIDVERLSQINRAFWTGRFWVCVTCKAS